MIAAGLVAVFQTNVRRMLAYSSLSQIGYITFGISWRISRRRRSPACTARC